MAFVASLLSECNEARREMIDGVLADDCLPLDEWGNSRLVQLFLSKHLGFHDRSFVAYGCLVMGMNPIILADWCMAQPGYLRWDTSAEDMANLICQHARGEWDGTTGKSIKDMYNPTVQQRTPIYTPTFAFDLNPIRIPVFNWWHDKNGELHADLLGYEYMCAGQEFWNVAAAKLRGYAKTLPSERGVKRRGY